MNIRKILEFAKNEFVYGGHLLYLGSVCIVFTFAVLLDIPVTWDFLIISYLIFYIIYVYNKLREVRSDALTNSRRAAHIVKYMGYLPWILCLCIIITSFLSLTFGNFASSVLILIMIMGGILYTERFKMYTNKISGFKSFYVSFIWVLLVFLLAVYYNAPLNGALFLVADFFFLRCIVNTAFFDIKDMDSDRLSGLKTLPIVLGEKGIFNFIQAVNILSFVPIIFGVYLNLLPLCSLAILIISLYTTYYLRLARDARTDIQNLSYIMVDGEYLLWPIIIIISKELINYTCSM